MFYFIAVFLEALIFEFIFKSSGIIMMNENDIFISEKEFNKCEIYGVKCKKIMASYFLLLIPMETNNPFKINFK